MFGNIDFLDIILSVLAVVLGKFGFDCFKKKPRD